MHQDLLNHVEQNWETLAGDTPYFAVLTDPTYKEGPNENFWISGQIVANHILADLVEAGMDYADMSACELGTGVGRVLKAMSCACSSVTGYDLSKRMVNLCRQNCPGTPCHVYGGNLPALSHDLVYSAIVLQHNPPALIGDLLKDMFQASKQAVWFQLPLPTGFEGAEKPEIPCIPMYGMTEDDVVLIGAECGFGLVFSKPNNYAGPGLDGRQYLFARNP